MTRPLFARNPVAVVALLLAGSVPWLRASDVADAAIARLAPGFAGRYRTVAIAPHASGRSTITVGADPDGRIVFGGDTPMAQVAAFGYYLRHTAGAHLSWNGDRLAPLAHPPVPATPIALTTPYRHRYAYNYCALGYTAPFWSWAQWEREIDFQASNGMNDLLVTAGIEQVWALTLRELGYPEARIAAFIPSSAFAPWWHMGNLEGAGAPVSAGRIAREAELGRKIVSRLRELGIRPVVPGFTGLMPHDIGTYVPGLKLVPQGNWCDGYVRPALLDPTSSEFPRLAAIWYRHVATVYGDVPDGYSGDLFHEGGKTGGVDVTLAARNVQAAMQVARPGAIWFVQAWGGNPKPALLRGLDPQHTLILALNQNFKTGGDPKGFGAFPWAFCEANNFGGKKKPEGGVPLFARLPSLLLHPDKPRGNVAGIGLMSESLGLTPSHYEAFFDNVWRTADVPLASWSDDYAKRRYGAADPDACRALRILAEGIDAPDFNPAGAVEGILCARPGRDVRKVSTWAPTTINRGVGFFADAAEAYLAAAPRLADEPLYRLDLGDTARCVLVESFRPALEAAMAAYDEGDLAAFDARSGAVLDILRDCDRLMAAEKESLLGRWLADARAKGETPEERAALERDARTLITTWCGMAPAALNDYSNRQWAGLIADYYLPRWETFFRIHREVLRGERRAADAAAWYRISGTDKAEVAFASATKTYPVEPTGDTVALSRAIVAKYAAPLRAWAAATPVRGLAWRLTSPAQTLAFDITDALTAPGRYRATFRRTSGANALKLREVAVYAGDKRIAVDTHAGWTGVENRANVYRLDLTAIVPVETNNTQAVRYTLRAEVEGAGGADSAGVLTIGLAP